MGYDGVVIVGTKLDTKDFEAEINYVERKLNDMIADYQTLSQEKGFNEQSNQAIELRKNIQKVSNQLHDLKEKQKKINQGGLPSLKEIMEDIGKSTKQTIKSIGRWALAIFSLRSAYMLIKNAINTIAGNDEQLKADIDYMKNALAYSLEPVIRKIVDFAKQLMFYIGYIIKAWTGKNIFENANKSLSNANKNAQKLSKTMAGFDEMNVISDTSTGGGTVTPSFDLSQMQGEVPEWIKWIAENKELILTTIAGITAGLTAWNMGVKGLKALGIGVAIAGITYAIISLIEFLKDPTFENFTNIIIGIGVAIVGVGVIISSLPVVITGAVIAIVALIVKNYDLIMGLFEKGINWLEHDFVNALRYLFGPLGDILALPIITAINVLKGAFEGFFGGIRQWVTGIVQLFKGDFKNGIANVFGGLKSIMLAPINALIYGINVLIRGVNKINFKAPDWVPVIGGKGWGFNLPQIPKLAVGGIVNLPSRGVPIGGAITGEAGAEGVIPLTNSQAMETLGQAIGRYITVNANITNTMNGRVISRELQKINNDNSFATNS